MRRGTDPIKADCYLLDFPEFLFSEAHGLKPTERELSAWGTEALFFSEPRPNESERVITALC
jgi:hypothetical protein